ncbi:UNVERIFIED_CONTAM: Aspartyl protease family protein 1 [Sesamum angustifolium]|uniref:Aspartyl protease family protein 1 n=1 Tax=Sesamum angustifolium TaxID=2727405 RepID=A0AAW2NJ99_9LAMI
MHHRFSAPVKEWYHRSRTGSPVHNWPEKGSVEYYVLLASHDRTIHRRALSGSDGALTFSEGNSTFRISSLGFLHYTTVTLGTPGMTFLVALDTGSDLFWVPCHCMKCASTDDSPYASDFELSIYDADRSSTSKHVTCTNDLCTHHDSCNGTSGYCPYYVSYVSSETSTSGILVEDILHLRTLDSDQEFYKGLCYIWVQTGSFLDIAAPNGLFGLGLEKVSVPSTLFREGYMANSFSMCFGHDGTGRINFGDKGSLDQEETPFHTNSFHPTYNVNVTQVRVGTTVLDYEFTALFDSGTSFTYLVDPFYTMLSDSHELVYCLAVVKSQELNIIGQNFMTGYRIVFDREKLVLGWKKSDCYNLEDSNASEAKPVNYAKAPPPTVVGPLNHTTQSDVRDTNKARDLAALSLYTYVELWNNLLLLGLGISKQILER